jgi:hypothetical protein
MEDNQEVWEVEQRHEMAGDSNKIDIDQPPILDDFDAGDFSLGAFQDQSKRRQRRNIIFVVLAVCVVASIIGVAVALTGGNDNNKSSSINDGQNLGDNGGGDEPTPTTNDGQPPSPGGQPSGGATTLAPTRITGPRIKELILPVSRFGGSEFDDAGSHQSKALQWLQSQDFGSVDDLDPDQIIQLYALACIFYSTYSVRTVWTDFHYGENVAIPGWFSRQDWLIDPAKVCLSWHGLTCNANGMVEKIDLNTNGLTGSFPSEVALLSNSLKHIDLFSNIIHNKGDAGNAWLGELTNLEILFYGTTKFEYDGVPTEIGLLTNLQQYDMSYTLYFGALDARTWKNLVNLNYLVMDGNAYNSSLPAELVALPNLEFIYAGFTFLEGGLDFVADMPVIRELWLDDNPGLVGTLPTTLGTVMSLASFAVANGGIFGTIPTEIGLLENMVQMWLYDNALNGTIPTEIGQIIRLQFFHVQDNDLAGDMPSQICDRRAPRGRLAELTADCDGKVTCQDDCCTCCGTDCVEGTARRFL